MTADTGAEAGAARSPLLSLRGALGLLRPGTGRPEAEAPTPQRPRGRIEVSATEADQETEVLRSAVRVAAGMAQAGDWESLSALAQDWETGQAHSPNGSPLTLVALRAPGLADGCTRGRQSNPVPRQEVETAVLASLRAATARRPDDWRLRTILAHALIDRAWLCRGDMPASRVPRRVWPAVVALLREAAAALAGLEKAAAESPMHARTSFALLGAAAAKPAELEAAAALCRRLDPRDVTICAAHGRFLPEAWSGDRALLSQVALRAYTADPHGMGPRRYLAYYWEALDAAADSALDLIDPVLVATALRDRIAAAGAPQPEVNTCAAWLLRNGTARPALPEPAVRQVRRAELLAVLRDVLEENLTVLIPARWEMPEAQIRRALDEVFDERLAAGETLRFPTA